MSATPPLPSTAALQPVPTRSVLASMRSMLAVVSLFAVVSTGVAIWLYRTAIPELHREHDEIRRQQGELAQQRADLERKDAVLARFCDDMATRENNIEHRTDDALRSIDSCVNLFPKDFVLPAYKAEILATRYSTSHSSPADVDAAIQAAQQSIAVKPNTAAYDWLGLAYCLKATHSDPATRAQSVQSAIHTFQDEAAKFHRDVRGMSEFSSDCPADVKAALGS